MFEDLSPEHQEKLKAFAETIANQVAPAVIDALRQNPPPVGESPVIPGRPVMVMRRFQRGFVNGEFIVKELDTPFQETTTVPQLLAELNDSLIELCLIETAEEREFYDHDPRGTPRRRSRRRR